MSHQDLPREDYFCRRLLSAWRMVMGIPCYQFTLFVSRLFSRHWSVYCFSLSFSRTISSSYSPTDILCTPVTTLRAIDSTCSKALLLIDSQLLYNTTTSCWLMQEFLEPCSCAVVGWEVWCCDTKLFLKALLALQLGRGHGLLQHGQFSFIVLQCLGWIEHRCNSINSSQSWPPTPPRGVLFESCFPTSMLRNHTTPKGLAQVQFGLSW